VNVVTMRSAWNDHDAAFVGFKGGDNAASHAHCDLGSFIYDVDGVRWAYDLGADDYNLPGYFGKKRWDYYRTRSEGHNTLTIDGPNQDPKATAAIVAFSADPKSAFAVVDLSKAYPSAKQVLRGVKLIGKGLLVEDEVATDEPVDVTWNFHTQAKIKIGENHRTATLTSAKKTMFLQLLTPASAHFEIADSDIAPATQSTVPQKVVKHGGRSWS